MHRVEIAFLQYIHNLYQYDKFYRQWLSPLATKPANTKLAEARKSVAITGAPVISGTPFNSRDITIELNIRAHASQFMRMHKTIFKNSFG